MGFSLWSLLKASLLVSNSLTILNRDRFLTTVGLASSQSGSATDPKNQIIGLLQAIQYMKVPLVVLNSIVIAVELLFGG